MTQKTHIVRSQLIPLDGMRLVMPNTSIAEVISTQETEAIDNMPNWLLGLIVWRGLKIPLLSFEAAVGDEPTKVSRRARVVVFNAINHQAELPFYAVLAQGIPRLMALTGTAIIDAPDQEATLFVLRHALVDGNPAMIPDLARFEQALHDLNIRAKEML